ncbi:MAG: UDP-N-acetylmuramoyl-tripeptide--D-alanyl-D-alanine ligase [Gallionella sp.]
MMTLQQATQVLNGRLVGKNLRFKSISSDSRKIAIGDLFVALRGDNFDGYGFVNQSAQQGAVAALVNVDSYQHHEMDCPLILVDDTQLALGKLAAHWRKQFQIPLVAITGSNGKTTVKEMLAHILRAATGKAEAVLATQGNFNNDIGMPLTLLGLKSQHRFAVIEMGMNHFGEIDYLTRIAEPTVVLINNASGAHLQGLGSVEAVAQAKGEIFNGLQHGGTAVINADDEYAPLWRTLAGAEQLLEFGLNPQADVSGAWQPHGGGLKLEVSTPLGAFVANLQVPGEHNARNALAATTAAIALNIPLEIIAAGLEKFGGVAGRLQRRESKQGAVIIDDTYNANPASLRAAIQVLADSAGKRVLVLGDMGELGDDAAMLHAEIGEAAHRAGIEKLLALGELSRNAVRKFGEGAQHFERIEELQNELDKTLDDHTTVLVKGSRFMKMERVVMHCVDLTQGDERRVSADDRRNKKSPATDNQEIH